MMARQTMSLASENDSRPTTRDGPDNNYMIADPGAGTRQMLMSSSREEAALVVKQIIEQLALKDFPPSNEESSVGIEEDIFSPQCHERVVQKYLRKISEIDDSSRASIETNSIGSDSSDLVVSSFFRSYLQENHTSGSFPSDFPPAHRLGNANLQALSAHTLQRLGFGSVPLEIETNILLSQINLNSPAESLKSSITRDKARARWGKKKPKDTSAPRVRMFASEYARHLSKSILAPGIEKKSSRRKNRTPRVKTGASILEEADASILAGAIVDICIVSDDQTPSKDYYKITQTATGHPFALTLKKKTCYIAVKKEEKWDRAIRRPCVTAIATIFPDRREFVPPGFSVVKYRGQPADLGHEERIFICFRRSREGNPITALLPLSIAHREKVPEGFTVIEKTPRDFAASLTGDSFLAYRQRLANLECLRPIPLLCTLSDNENDGEGPQYLKAYYCTGGTTVHADIGQFHVMDRSAPALIGSSNVIQRVKLIEKARRNESESESQSGGTVLTLGTNSNDEYCLYSDPNGSQTTENADEKHHSAYPLTLIDSVTLSSLAASVDQNIGRPNEDPRLGFIPSVGGNFTSTECILEHRKKEISLIPILTACYTRHGGTSRVAISGLIKLLRQSDMFIGDKTLGKTGTHFSLLDVAVQSVCDAAITGAAETMFSVCVEFVSEAVAYTGGCLNARTIGIVMRFYMFLFNFGASIPDRTIRWPNPAWSFQKPGHPILHDPRDSAVNNCPYLPGGAPQVAALALKDLFTRLLNRLSTASNGRPLKKSETDADSVSSIDGLVSSIDESMERSSFLQLTRYQIQQPCGSELFWYDMINICGPGLFSKDPSLSEASQDVCVVIFAALTSMVKVASDSTPASDKPATPKDQASKLLAFELVAHFLESFDALEKSYPRAMGTILCCIRRTLVPCLLENTASALQAPEVYSRIVRIMTIMWRCQLYRQSLKLEIGLLLEHFGIYVLQASEPVECSKTDHTHAAGFFFQQKLFLLRELKSWFTEDPKDSIELFLNYQAETDGIFQSSTSLFRGKHWNIYSRLCSELSKIADHGGVTKTPKDRQVKQRDEDCGQHSEQLRLASVSIVEQLAKSLSFSAELLLVGARRSASPDEENQNRQIEHQLLTTSHGKTEEETNTAPVTPMGKAPVEESVENAIELSKQKSLKTAIEYLVSCGHLSLRPRDVVSFLHVHHDRFDPTVVGEYLGEGGVSALESGYWNIVRYLFVRDNNFVGLTVEQALRRFLTDSGFRLPGEAQKVDRIVEAFARCFFEDNVGDRRFCPLPNEDAVYVLCFAIIMLNTDLHKASKSTRKLMTEDEFVENLAGTSACSKVPREYLSCIYESISANPIELNDRGISVTEDENISTQAILKNGRFVESLIRGLAVHQFEFVDVEELEQTNKSRLLDLTTCCVLRTSHHWHGLINTGFDMAYVDPDGVRTVLNILMHALSACLCLDLTSQFIAFLKQLERAGMFEESWQDKWGIPALDASYVRTNWYTEIEKAATSGRLPEKMWSLSEIRPEMEKVRRKILLVVSRRAGMLSAVEQLQNGDHLYHDFKRSFRLSGKLVKRSTRTGRFTQCWLYLFSDKLVYAKETEQNRIVIDQEFDLTHIKVVDWFPPSQRDKSCQFDVHHPSKTLQIICPSVSERKQWVTAIRGAS